MSPRALWSKAHTPRLNVAVGNARQAALKQRRERLLSRRPVVQICLNTAMLMADATIRASAFVAAASAAS